MGILLLFILKALYSDKVIYILKINKSKIQNGVYGIVTVCKMCIDMQLFSEKISWKQLLILSLYICYVC